MTDIFTCACGAPAIAIRPGTANEECEILGTVFIITRGEPSQSYCLTCWPASWRAPDQGGDYQPARHLQPKDTPCES